MIFYRSGNKRIRWESSGASYALLITDLQEEDAGAYQCELIGKSGGSTTTSCILSRDSCLSMIKKISKLTRPAHLSTDPLQTDVRMQTIEQTSTSSFKSFSATSSPGINKLFLISLFFFWFYSHFFFSLYSRFFLRTRINYDQNRCLAQHHDS